MRPALRRSLRVLVVLLVLVLLVVGVRAARYGAVAAEVPAVPIVALDGPAMAERLAAAVRCPTLSVPPGEDFDVAPFQQLHEVLAASFPRVHAELQREEVAEAGLLYTWVGSDPAAAPVLLLAHQDVVPAVDPEQWQQPPFAGTVTDDFVWGRGTLDDKGSLMAQLEAVELLLAQGFRPRRTVLLAFGHDEEVGGQRGAGAIAALLAERGVHPAWSLDEGLAVVEDLVPGVAGKVAMVGIAEKGYLSLELVVEAEGGHSSMPPADNAIARISRAIDRLGKHPLPGGLDGPVAAMFEHLAPRLPLTLRVLLANRWLFGGLVAAKLGASPQGNALLRTTTAPTMLEAGVRPNVLPTRARAVVNFRLHPRDTVAGVIAHTRAAVADPKVQIQPLDGAAQEPSTLASTGSEGFLTLQRTVSQVFPGAAVAPGLVLAGTDSRHYATLATDSYRFAPFRLGPGDLQRVHGRDERIAVTDYANMVRFYLQLLRNAGE